MVEETILTRNHPSRFGILKYTYPVISRRAGGVSIGINLSPNHECSFRCLYCQVPVLCSSHKLITRTIDTIQLAEELHLIANTVLNGSLFECERFRSATAENRVLRDFALSGDGEPTMSPSFHEVVKTMVAVRQGLALDSLKLVLITNATRLDETQIQESLELLMAHGGVIWAKLDAGTEEGYRRINRSSVPYSRLLLNIEETGRKWPIWIQTMALRNAGQLASEEDWSAYRDRIVEMKQRGVQISGIQLYTVARRPLENIVSALTNEELDSVRERLATETGVAVESYYSK